MTDRHPNIQTANHLSYKLYWLQAAVQQTSSSTVAERPHDALGRMKMQVWKNQVPGREGGGGKMQVRKEQVQMCKDGKCKYRKMKLA